jgi:uncharacterized HAD superfamily protein
LKIGSDIDGVITDLPARMVQVAQEKFGKVIKPEDVYRKDEQWLTKDELNRMFEPEFFFDMLPYERNIKALQLMSNEGHEIHFITARPFSTEMGQVTQDYFEKHGVPWATLYFDEDKAKVAEQLGLERFIEDFSSNANALAQVLPRVYLIDQPYNLKDELRGNVLRVNSVMEVRNRLRLEIRAVEQGEQQEQGNAVTRN